MSIASAVSDVVASQTTKGQKRDVKSDEEASTSRVFRQRTLTEKGFEWRLAQLKDKRKALSVQLTVKSNAIRLLFDNYENINVVKEKLIEWSLVYESFIEAHQEYCFQLSGELVEPDKRGWFEPKDNQHREFRMQAEQWACEAEQYHEQQYVDERIGPNDSISQIGSKSRSRCGSKKSVSVKSKASSRTQASSAWSAKLKEEARKAELLARSALLKQKQMLEDEEIRVRRMKEQFKLQSEMAISDAKVKVYEKFEDVSNYQEQSYVYPDEVHKYNNIEGSGDPRFASIASKEESKPFCQKIQSSYKQMNIPEAPIKSSVNEYAIRAPTQSGKDVSVSHKDEDSSTSLRPTSEQVFFKLLQQQNEITMKLIDQQLKATLPPRNINEFNGDPLQYNAFIKAFEQGIEEKTTSNSDRIYFLEQFTSGEPNSLVRSCMYLEGDGSYLKAKELLKSRFGNAQRVTAAYVNKALNWPNIPSEDATALNRFALFLTECTNTLHDLQYTNEMEHSTSMKIIVSKLPFKLRAKWRDKAYGIQKNKGRMVKLADLTSFVEEQSDILINSPFGEILEDARSNAKGKSKKENVYKQRNFATKAGDVSDHGVIVSGLRSRNNIQLPIPKDEISTKDASTCTSPQYNAFEKPCMYCKGDHGMNSCKRLANKPFEEKFRFLRPKGICFGCLTTGHIKRDCNKKLMCSVCKEFHPTVLHIHKKKESEQNETKPKVSSLQGTRSPDQRTEVCGFIGAGNFEGTMAIIPVKVKSKEQSECIRTYAFLDNGSSATFCTEGLMRRLHVKGRKSKISLRTMGQEQVIDSHIVRGLEISGLDGDKMMQLPSVFTQKEMPVSRNDIVQQSDIEGWPYLKDIHLPSLESEVELLIGNNCVEAMEPWEIINSENGGPYAIKTTLGWTVNGVMTKSQVASGDGAVEVRVNRTSVISEDHLRQQLVSQFNHDFNERIIEDKPEKSLEDQRFMQLVSSTLKRSNKHYEIGLPFRDPKVRLPNNKVQASHRALQIQRKLERDPKLHKDYTRFMEDVIDNGFARKVPKDQLKRDDGRVWYIPHHAVYHPRKPDKVRVVFYCSSRFQGISLNDQLLPGPNLTSTLLGVLLRFRQEPVALMADVENMFYQVKVPPNDYDVLRFLWWPNGNTNVELEEYQMTVHIFGAVSSPSCANYALKKIAEDQKGKFDKEVIETIQKNFYVDDCLKSVTTTEKAITLARNLSEACESGGFRLTKWTSNSRAVLDSIPGSERSKEIKNLDLEKDDLPVERALGMEWCVQTDKFKFNSTVKDKSPSRRGILAVVSSVYDPLGIISPFILKAKILLQSLCRMKFSWDDLIPDKHLSVWSRWLSELPSLPNVVIERCLKPKNFGEIRVTEIHHFCDASEVGYGVVTYVRLVNSKGKVHCSFLLGKARVAPLKQTSIPRLELTAATVAVRVNEMVRREIDIQVNDIFYWTDSMSVLRYISNETARFHTFVANRIAVIHDGSTPNQWKYVASELNPADDASRGKWIQSFKDNDKWLNGPDFLWKPVDEWPNGVLNGQEIPKDDPEVKRELKLNVVLIEEHSATVNKFITYFSSWRKLKRCTAWLLRLKVILQRLYAIRTAPATNKSNSSKDSRSTTLTLNELKESEEALLSFTQRQFFPEEISRLENPDQERKELSDIRKHHRIKKTSPLYKLDPRLENGLLKVGGRLSRAIVSEDVKHPVIVPRKSHIAELIIREEHEVVGHSGRNHVLSNLRQRYWIVKGNAAVREVLNKCVKCKRNRGKIGEQKMAELPADRLVPDEPPFTRVGVDLFGPIEVKRGRSMIKRYGVVFTCLVIRAIHIEVAFTLDTDSFINALRRFVSRRGQVKVIYSDNGTNLVGAERELRNFIRNWNQSKIEEVLIQKNIEWNFNPPTASHYGGVWERQIRTIRKILCSVLKEQLLNDESLQTLLCEVESIINGRPITKVSSDPNDLEALTPNHLLLLKSKPMLSPGLFVKEDVYGKRRWRQIQYLAEIFWKRWLREYLPLLQERQKWLQPKRNVQVGDIVLLVEPTLPRNSWRMGRVTKVFADRENLVRSVEVKTKTAVFHRPVVKLCLLLEADSNV